MQITIDILSEKKSVSKLFHKYSLCDQYIKINLNEIQKNLLRCENLIVIIVTVYFISVISLKTQSLVFIIHNLKFKMITKESLS